MPSQKPNILWPPSSSPGATPPEGSGRLINCYGEPLAPGAASEMVLRRLPAVQQFSTTTRALNTFRGGILIGGLVFACFADKVITIDAGGTETVLGGVVPGTGPVTFARNNIQPTPSIIVCDSANGSSTIAAGVVTAFNGAGNLPQPNSVAGQDSYLFWSIGDNRIFAAGPNSLVVNTQTFTTVQSRPVGTLLRLIPDSGLLYAFTSKYCEVYNNTSNPFPTFPYSRQAVLDRGLIGRNAIAGWEDGFGDPYFVGDDGGVYHLDGYTPPTKVSSPDVDRAIAQQAKIDPDGIVAYCYVDSGHMRWGIRSPLWTWELNVNTMRWSERASFNNGATTPWRGLAVGGINAFGKWLLGDVLTSKMLYLDDKLFNEVGSPYLFRAESQPVRNFPNRLKVGRVEFDIVPGVGKTTGTNPNQTNPRAGISWSDDGGVNWSIPLLRDLGATGKSLTRVWATNLGQSGPQGRRWRYDVTDDVYVGLMGGSQTQSSRAN